MNEEALLINELKHKNVKVFMRLYDKYASEMKYICLRYLKNDVDAEDALQEGFIKVFNCIQQYNGVGAFEGWMKRIFINTAITMYKKKKQYFSNIELSENIFVDEVSDVDENYSTINHVNIDPFVEEGKLEEIDVEIIQKMVDTIPDPFRIVFNMYVVDGFKHKEIAEKLGISSETSKTRLMRARKYVQEQIGKFKMQKTYTDK